MQDDGIEYESPHRVPVPIKPRGPKGQTPPNGLNDPIPQKIIKGKVKELIQPKQIKVPEPIQAMVRKDRLTAQRLLDVVVGPDLGITLGMILNESPTLIKGLAHSLQSSTPRY